MGMLGPVDRRKKISSTSVLLMSMLATDFQPPNVKVEVVQQHGHEVMVDLCLL